MKWFTLCILAFSMVTARPAAADTVLCYMDSRGFCGALGTCDGGPTICDLLASARPDLAVVNKSMPGRPTCDEGLDWNGAPWTVKQTLKDLINQHGAKFAVIMLGVNDHIHCSDNSPAAVVGRLRSLASAAHGRGATAVIVTPPPVIDCHGGAPHCGLRKWGRDVQTEWIRRNRNPARITANARDEFLTVDWLSCAPDGVHPHYLDCRTPIADAISEVIPVASP